MIRSINLIILLLIGFLPFHTLIIDKILSQSISYLNLWKELFIIVLFLLSLILNKSQKINNNNLYLIYGIFSLFILCITFMNTFNYESLKFIRYYLFPPLLLITLSSIQFDENLRVKFYSYYIIVAIISVFFGFIQVHFLGDQFLLNLGYPRWIWDQNRLDFAFYISGLDLQRMCSGFIGPIPFGTYLLSALLLEFSIKRKKLNYKIIIITVLLFGIFSAMNRSVIISLFLILIIFYKNKIFKVENFKLYSIILFILLIIYFYLNIFNYELLNKIFSFPLINNFLYFKDDPSFRGHLNSWKDVIDYIDISFTGVGPGFFGKVEMLEENYYFKTKAIESTFLSGLVEIGIIGLTLYVILLIKIFLTSYKKSLTRQYIFFYFLISIILPLQYYSELNYLLFLIMGLEMSKKINTHNEVL